MTLLDGLERELRKTCPVLELRKNEPMSRHTTFRIGGPAALMAIPTGEEIQRVMEAAFRCNVKPFFLGNGSNLLVSDRGYDGFVIKLSGLYGKGEVFDNELMVGGAMLLSQAANLALEHGLTGLEWAAGIPGTVGGAVTMNAGAYGGDISQTLHQVHTLGFDGRQAVFSNSECGFAYRRSVFSKGEHLVLAALFLLEPGDPAAIKAKMIELAAQRKAKQPLDYPSAGSAFKRPAPLSDGTPVYAAALIDRCGCKGLRVGGAQVSEKHAGFVVNTGGATCADVLALAAEVQGRVLEQTGTRLELEIRTLGVEMDDM